MAWSTSELARYASTTIKTIRHYHDVGLLDVPERAENGYKLYSTRHLVRLLHIRRLRALGMSVQQIAGLDGPDGADSAFATTVQALDAELAESIARQQAVRAELAELMRYQSTADVPQGFGAVAPGLTSADRALITVMAQLYSEEVAQDMRGMAVSHPEFDEIFNDIPGDADEAAVRAAAERLAPVVRSIRAEYPTAGNRRPFARSDELEAIRVVREVLVELYNPAQVTVLQEIDRILAAEGPPT